VGHGVAQSSGSCLVVGEDGNVGVAAIVMAERASGGGEVDHSSAGTR